MSTSAHSLNGNNRPVSVSGPSLFLEGWFILLLGALSSGLLGAVVGDYATDADPAALATLATAGYLFGYFLARALLPDIFAHVVMFLLGIVVALVAIDPGLLWDQLSAGQWRPALDRYETLIRGFLTSIDTGGRFESDVAIFALSLTMWMVGYTAAWLLFRRGWIFWSLALPGAILLVTLALDRDRPTWPALLYLGIALGIAATHTAMSRSAFWRSRSISQPSSMGRRSILLGCVIAALAVAVGLYYSFDLDDRLQERAVESGDRVASWLTNRFDESGSTPPGSQPVTGNYGAFSDQFKVGDGVPTGDSPLVVVQSNDEEYLAARRLNQYDGSGWRSTTGASDDAVDPPPSMAFQTDQPMIIPRDQLQSRAQDQASIVLLQPTGELLFTIDQHFSTSVPTLVRVGWQAIDETYTLGEVDLSQVPADLQELMVLLQSADFSNPSESDTPQFISSQDQLGFEQIRNRLAEDYPVSTELSWTDDGSIQVHLDGRLPVYADVEAVFANEEMAGEAYSVIGLIPQMTADELASAGTDYPQYISDNYLDLPESVTAETRSLANQIVVQSGATNPYDQAVAIQTFLRDNFTYQIDAGPAPGGRDIVDYFLFESRVGRCDHYSSSMAVMLRSLGVPTRIVTGLAPVPYDSDMSGYVYRGRNAHAWVEVYFPGYGWIQFEPTPTQDTVGLDSVPSEPQTTPEPTPTPASTEITDGTQTAPTPTPSPTPLPAPATSDTGANDDSSSGMSPWGIGLGAGVIALVAGGLFYFWRRRSTFAGLPIAAANFGRLQRLGGFIGVRAAPELTPREYAASFGSARPQSAAGALRVADAFTQEQYATNIDAGTIARDSDYGWQEAKSGATDWRLWRRR